MACPGTVAALWSRLGLKPTTSTSLFTAPPRLSQVNLLIYETHFARRVLTCGKKPAAVPAQTRPAAEGIGRRGLYIDGGSSATNMKVSSAISPVQVCTMADCHEHARRRLHCAATSSALWLARLPFHLTSRAHAQPWNALANHGRQEGISA